MSGANYVAHNIRLNAGGTWLAIESRGLYNSTMIARLLLRLFALLLTATSLAFAQDKGSLNSAHQPTLPNLDNPTIPAKVLFGRKKEPVPTAAQAVGSYARGCMAGAVPLPVSGETWQVMRLSRNRNWGHPNMIEAITRIAGKAPAVGWRGLLVGDIAQTRGGPMRSGHASHQTGLDADIWFVPMPEHKLSQVDREKMSATNVVTDDGNDVRPEIWSHAYIGILKLTAEDPEVERVLVNPAIKKALCRDVKNERGWLSKIRPWYGHNDHFHVRIKCPSGDTECKPQTPPSQNDECGPELAWWFTDEARKPKVPPVRPPEIKLYDLPPPCRQIVASP